MKKNLKYLAIIPARSGSERVKNKNLIKIKGDPLIGIAIKNAVRSKLFNKVILSTDSKKYYTIGQKYGADPSKIRPKNISKSSSTDYEHIKYQVDYLAKCGEYFDIFVILRPTNPFRTIDTIKRAIHEFEKESSKVDSLRAVREVNEHPYKMWIKNKKLLKPLFPLKNKKGIDLHSSQKKTLPKIFIQSAMIEVSWIYNLKYKSISGKNVLSFFGTKKENFDINEPEDLNILGQYLKEQI